MKIRDAQARVAGHLGLSPRQLWILLGTHAAAFVAGALLF